MLLQIVPTTIYSLLLILLPEEQQAFCERVYVCDKLCGCGSANSGHYTSFCFYSDAEYTYDVANDEDDIHREGGSAGGLAKR